MTTMMNQNKIYSEPDLRAFLETKDVTECHIYPYGYYDEETSEDPIAQLFGIDETMNWIAENPAYSTWGEQTGYMVVAFNHSGYADAALF